MCIVDAQKVTKRINLWAISQRFDTLELLCLYAMLMAIERTSLFIFRNTKKDIGNYISAEKDVKERVQL